MLCALSRTIQQREASKEYKEEKMNSGQWDKIEGKENRWRNYYRRGRYLAGRKRHIWNRRAMQDKEKWVLTTNKFGALVEQGEKEENQGGQEQQ